MQIPPPTLPPPPTTPPAAPPPGRRGSLRAAPGPSGALVSHHERPDESSGEPGTDSAAWNPVLSPS